MGSYVVRMRVLPADTSTEHQKMIDSVKAVLPSGAQIRGQKVEPIAFGLSAIILDLVIPEEEGAIDRVEQAVSTASLVGGSELVGVSRMSSKLPPS